MNTMSITSVYRLKVIGRCYECDGCMMCQDEREPEYDEWDMDEDLLREED